MKVNIEESVELAVRAAQEAERLGLLITADNLREVADELSELAAASGNVPNVSTSEHRLPQRNLYH